MSRPTDRRSPEFNLLKIIPVDLKLFDNVSVSSGQESELSGPFSENDKIDGFAEKRRSNELNETDLYTYFSFSEEFRSAVESVKSEMKNSKIDSCEDEEEMAEEQTSQIQIELEKKAEEIFRQTRFLFWRRKEKPIESEEEKSGSNSDLQKIGKKPKSKDERKIYESDDYFDTMSGYWRILSNYDEFRISHPDYNAYENEKPHWLETKPIPFEVIENSRKKCLDWLKENFENY